jgi:glutaryl-CoA dehydrogenase (non-decarboxylating)
MREARAFTEAELLPHADRFDAEGALPRAFIAKLADRGWLGAALSTRWGGGGLDAPTWGRLHGDVGRACGSTRSLLTVQTLVGLALERWAPEPLKARYLPALARGELLAAFALSEPSAGSDVQGLEARARPHGDGYVLDGVKRWISFGQIAHLFLVFARLEGGMAAFLVEGSSPGLTREPITGLLGVRATQLNGCFVPASHRVGGGDLPFSPVAATALDVGRYSVAWGCVGQAEACLAASMAHARTRRQFGKPLLEHELVARKLTDMLTDTRAARLLCQEAGAKRKARAPDSESATMMAKYFASTAASRISADAVQLHGASGCIQGSRVERHFRDARIMEIIEGSTQMQQVMIARHCALDDLEGDES